jgi:hypothetical protein
MTKSNVGIAVINCDTERLVFEAGSMHAACIPACGESMEVQSSYTDGVTISGKVIDRQWTFRDHELVQVDLYLDTSVIANPIDYLKDRYPEADVVRTATSTYSRGFLIKHSDLSVLLADDHEPQQPRRAWDIIRRYPDEGTDLVIGGEEMDVVLEGGFEDLASACDAAESQIEGLDGDPS